MNLKFKSVLKLRTEKSILVSCEIERGVCLLRTSRASEGANLPREARDVDLHVYGEIFYVHATEYVNV